MYLALVIGLHFIIIIFITVLTKKGFGVNLLSKKSEKISKNLNLLSKIRQDKIRQDKTKKTRIRTDRHSELIEHLWTDGTITDQKVKNAMLKVDRKDFTDIDPYHDKPKTIGHGATISAPHMHAHALEQLKNHLKPGMKAMDVGSGSGYLTVCMAYMVMNGGSGLNIKETNKGKVIGVEHIKELYDKSIININKNHSHLLQNNIITMINRDGRKGYIEEAKYDAIHVGATSQLEDADYLATQLKNGGMMVIPVELKNENKDQVFRKYMKDNEGQVTHKDLMGVKYVPLTSESKQRSR